MGNMRRVIERISKDLLASGRASAPVALLACIEDSALTYIVRTLFIWTQGRGPLSGVLGQQLINFNSGPSLFLLPKDT